MNNNTFLNAALAGNIEAAYLAFEACFAQERPSLVVPDEPLSNEPLSDKSPSKEIARYRKLFKTLQLSLEPENRQSALSRLEHKFVPQTSEIGALARIMLVFLQSNTHIEAASTERYPACLKRVSLYKKAIAQAEEIGRPEIAEVLKKDYENYVHTFLWDKVLLLDELSLLPNGTYSFAKDLLTEAYKNHLLVIISFYSKGDIPQKILDCTLPELIKIAIEKLKERTESSSLQGSHKKDLFATFWLATLYMRQDFYVFTDLPEANYLLCQLERSIPLNSSLHAWVQAKRLEITLLNASDLFELEDFNFETLEEKVQKKEDAIVKAKACAINKGSLRSLQGLANVRLALFILKEYPKNHFKESLTLQMALQRALVLLEPSSCLVPLVNYHLGKLFVFGDAEIVPKLEEGRKLLKKAAESPVYANDTMVKKMLYLTEIIEKNTKFEFSPELFAKRRLAIQLVEQCVNYFDMSLHHAVHPSLFRRKSIKEQKKQLSGGLAKENIFVSPDLPFSEDIDCDPFLKEKLEKKDKDFYVFKKVFLEGGLRPLFCPEKFGRFYESLLGLINEHVIDLKEAYQIRTNGKKYFRYETLKRDSEKRTLKLTYHPNELIENILGTAKDVSAHPELLKKYLLHLDEHVRTIYRFSALKMNWMDESKVSRELTIPYDVSSHLLMQGIRELLDTLEEYISTPELKQFFTINLIKIFKDLCNFHVLHHKKLAQNSQPEKELIPYLISTAKYLTHVISKVRSQYPSDVLQFVYDNYTKAADRIPNNYRFNLFFDVAKFFKKAHFCNRSETSSADAEWCRALEFNLRALEVANEEESLLVFKNIYKLSPKKIKDFVVLYDNYTKSISTHPERYECFIAFFFFINIEYRRFIGKEQEAEELRQLIDKDERSLPVQINALLNARIHFGQPNVSQLPSQTEMARHILETLGPSYPSFEESILQITTPKKQAAKRNQKEADSNQITLESSTQTCKSNPRKGFQANAITSIAEQELQQSYLEQNASSTTTEVKKEAKHQLLKEEERLAKKRAKQSKAAIPSIASAAPPVQSIPAQPLPCSFLTPSEMDIFNEFFKPKRSCAQEVQQGNFDAYSFRNDVKISRDETKKLVEALGGKYYLGGAKGSHNKAVIPSLDTNDQMVFNGKTMTVANLNLSHNPQSETLILPQNKEDCLKFYMVQQIREKLLSLNFSPKTVKIRI